MSEFLVNLTSLYWWISVVIVGLAINVLASYIVRKLDVRLSGISSWWRARSDKAKAKEDALLARLRADTHEQILVALEGIAERVFVVLLVMSSMSCWAAILSRAYEATTSGYALTVLKWLVVWCMLFGTVTMLMAITLFFATVKKANLIEEARFTNPPVDDEQT